MLSQGLGVYHMASRNTSIGVPGRCVLLRIGKLQTLSATPGDSSYPNLRLSNIIRINFSEDFFAICSPANFGEECSKENYLSTMLPYPFMDLKWHKGKKLRHHRHLSLLLRGLLVTKPVVILGRVWQTPLKHGVLCRFVRCCSFLLHAKLNLPLLLCPSHGRRLCEIP